LTRSPFESARMLLPGGIVTNYREMGRKTPLIPVIWVVITAGQHDCSCADGPRPCRVVAG